MNPLQVLLHNLWCRKLHLQQRAAVLEEIHYLLQLDLTKVPEGSHYLIEINLTSLNQSSTKKQVYWLFAMCAVVCAQVWLSI